ncbi:hypothetical protein [Streptomyces sp. NBC_00557]|uniref:hypothetical protein n=1 Tax=Streptomyces sp. NBC_00557 TaxID=2975776 RepID=UPI002E801397|nr:hypothetical protein [Streptomyces sp. NBC_00557]WUC32788.1 hypothetical protein OG956_00380 [Streptomyces sp. NBC_00557]
MKKIMSRVARAGVSAALIGSALWAAGGSATAAPFQTDAHTKAVAGDSRNLPGHQDRTNGSGYAGQPRGAHDRPDPWVAGQLEVFDPWIADQLAMFDPWISDQLAMFVSADGHGR